MEPQELDLTGGKTVEQKAGPVTCLGKTFENDEDRRKYFTEKLREKLQDPEFRKIEGFPIGDDEDILNLSDPPYYTACPNPWIADFIAEREAQKATNIIRSRLRLMWARVRPIPSTEPIHTTPKYLILPLCPLILHYSEPGDIVLE